MQTETPKFKAWLAAEKDAQAAERELHAAMVQFAADSSPPPMHELLNSALARRKQAHALFDEAMQELRDIAESLHHRRIVTSGAIRLEAQGPTH